MKSTSLGARALRKMYTGVGLLLLVGLLGVVGYLMAGWSVGDAAYMVIITIFGVGYGEVRPVETMGLRLLTGTIIVAGYASVIYVVGGFIQTVIDGELNEAFGARRMSKVIDRLEGHTIICGYGRMGEALAADLAAAGMAFVAIDANPDTFERSPEADEIPHIVGDATSESILELAGIDRAAALATVLSDDANNVFVALTARAMNTSLFILARADNRSSESKLRNCGADTVVLPTEIGANRMSQLIAKPSSEQLLEQIHQSGDVELVHLGLEFDEIEMSDASPWVNRTLAEVEVRGAHGYLIIGVRHPDGSLLMHPDGDLRLAPGDRVIVLGYHDDIPELGTKITRRPGTYRGTPTN